LGETATSFFADIVETNRRLSLREYSLDHANDKGRFSTPADPIKTTLIRLGSADIES
jgi:hypothetical protein